MKTRNILLGTLVMMAFTACNNDDSENVVGGKQNVATFTASIDGRMGTRAYDQIWEDGDAIGITGTTGGKAYENVQYETHGGGNFNVSVDGSEIYYQDNNDVAFTAYYPWNESTTITASTLEQANQKSFDFLYATGTGKKAAPNVAFNFEHKMTKVVLNILKGADISIDEVKAAKLALGGFLSEGSFDGLAGTAAATAGDLATLEFANNTANEDYNAPKRESADAVAYTLILYPQTFAAALPFSATLEGMQAFNANLDFTAANTAANDENPGNYWTGGRQYNLSITLHKTKITVENCTIQPWNEVDGGNVDAQ